MSTTTIPAIGRPLRWVHDPVDHEVVGDDALAITAGPTTDLFADPGGDAPVDNAPMLLATVPGDLLLRATVEVGFASAFDAGALVVRDGPERWAKLAFEWSPQHRPTIVSVVTRGVSDDANAMVVDEPSVELRIARIGVAHAFHVRTGGSGWQLVRYFRLGAPGEVGFLAQSPLGDGTRVQFRDIVVEQDRLEDLRGGE